MSEPLMPTTKVSGEPAADEPAEGELHDEGAGPDPDAADEPADEAAEGDPETELPF